MNRKQSTQKKKILVTGGYGMLGSNLVARLSSMGHDVVVVDNNSRGMKDHALELWAKNSEGGSIDVIESDVRDLAFDEHSINTKLRGASACVHLADIVAGIGYVFGNQYKILHENIAIDRAAFELTVAAGIQHLIYASTACAFNQDRQRSIRSQISIANDLYPANPESTYGWAKTLGDISIANLDPGYDLSKTTIFFHNLVGVPCDFWSEKSQFVPAISKRAVENSHDSAPILTVWGSGQQGRALVPVRSAVDAIVFALGHPNRYYHVGPEFCTTVLDVAEQVVATLGANHTIEFDTTKPEGDIGRSVDPAEENKIPKLEITRDDVRAEIRNTVDWIRNELGNG